MKPAVFEVELIHALEDRSGGTLHVSGDRISVTNREKARVLKLWKEDCRLMPVVYTDEYEKRFREGETAEALADEILNQIKVTEERYRIPEDFFRSFEAVCGGIFCRVISAERNRELLKQIPHELQEDLAIVYYYELKEDWISDASILIRKEHLSLWNCTEQELKCEAWKNTQREKKVRFCSLSEVLSEFGVKDAEAAMTPLYLLTAEEGSFGAVTAFFPGVLADCAEKIGSDMILLPSSIHEWLMFPSDGTEPDGEKERLRNMVREINQTQVAEKEVLSDEIYFYDSSKDRFTLI